MLPLLLPGILNHVVTSLVSISRVQGFLQSEEPEPTFRMDQEPSPVTLSNDAVKAPAGDAMTKATTATSDPPAGSLTAPASAGASAAVAAAGTELVALGRPPRAPRQALELVMQVRGGSFKWTRAQPTPTLSDVNVDIRKGQLIGVVGMVRMCVPCWTLLGLGCVVWVVWVVSGLFALPRSPTLLSLCGRCLLA